MSADNLMNKTFGNLEVVDLSSKLRKGPNLKPLYICKCKCGKMIEVPQYELLSGHKKSCGCLHIKHHFSHRERLYQTWINMRRRCNNSKNKRWYCYGGKGIKVCIEWDEYLSFRNWALSNGYKDNLTIDRIDVNGDYYPENCRWVDAKTQANNMTRNVHFDFNGELLTKSQLAERLGLSYSALQHRLDRGWIMERIIIQPQRSRKYGT